MYAKTSLDVRGHMNDAQRRLYLANQGRRHHTAPPMTAPLQWAPIFLRPPPPDPEELRAEPKQEERRRPAAPSSSWSRWLAILPAFLLGGVLVYIALELLLKTLSLRLLRQELSELPVQPMPLAPAVLSGAMQHAPDVLSGAMQHAPDASFDLRSLVLEPRAFAPQHHHNNHSNNKSQSLLSLL